MGADWVQLFDLDLYRRISAMDRPSLERYLEENLTLLKLKACRRADAAVAAWRSAATPEAREEARRERQNQCAETWDRALRQVRAGPARYETKQGQLLRSSIAEDAAVEGEERIVLDRCGAFAEVFGALPDGAVSSLTLVPGELEEQFTLLLPEHVDRMLRSLRERRGEWQTMTDGELQRLTRFRDRCRRNQSLRVAYFFDR